MMKLKVLVLLFFSILFVFAASVNAQVSSIGETSKDSNVDPAQKAREIPLKELRIRKNLTEKRDFLKEKTDAFKDRLKIQEKKREFKEKLSTIRDERKKALVERIDSKISTTNSARTAKLSSILEKIEMVLNKISDKAQTAESKGVDVSTVDSAIATARTAIDAAKAAIADQATKTYTPDISSEAALKTGVGSIVSTFRKDLRDVHKTVVDAKQAVQTAEKELAKVREGQGVTVPSTVIEPSVNAE